MKWDMLKVQECYTKIWNIWGKESKNQIHELTKQGPRGYQILKQGRKTIKTATDKKTINTNKMLGKETKVP